jgi:hypothetical protein
MNENKDYLWEMRMWKKEDMTNPKILTQHSPGGLKKTLKNFSQNSQ